VSGDVGAVCEKGIQFSAERAIRIGKFNDLMWAVADSQSFLERETLEFFANHLFATFAREAAPVTGPDLPKDKMASWAEIENLISSSDFEKPWNWSRAKPVNGGVGHQIGKLIGRIFSRFLCQRRLYSQASDQ
jgi:hypothetical protein